MNLNANEAVQDSNPVNTEENLVSLARHLLPKKALYHESRYVLCRPT
jgi:hypothetical protein